MLILSPPAVAQNDTSGAGFHPCATAMLVETDERARWAAAQWVLGYMTGLNAASIAETRRFRDLRGMAPEIVFAYVRRHCERNPQDRVLRAAHELWRSLPVAE